MLNLLLVTLGLAWLTELAGLSLALGAFVAGMLVSETEYKHQVETDIRPFHDVLLGPVLHHHRHEARLAHRWSSAGRWCCCCCCCRWLFKFVLVTVLARVLRRRRRASSLRTGLYLAQAGEFGFVLLTLAQRATACCRRGCANPVLASMVLSMLATPFIIMYSNRIVRKLVASDWLQQSLQMTTIARKTINTDAARDHLRLRPLRPEPGAHAGARRHPLHGARPRPRPRAPGRRGRRLGGVRRRGAAAGADGRRPGARQRGGRDLPRRARRAEGAGQHARARAAGAGDRAHAGRPRPREAAGRRRDRGRARGDRGLADAGQPCAGAGRRADAARDPRGAGPARRALQPAARLLPRRRRRHRRRARPRAAATASRCRAGARAVGQPLARLALHALGVRVASLRRRDGKAEPMPTTTRCWRTATRWCCPASRARWPWRSTSCRQG